MTTYSKHNLAVIPICVPLAFLTPGDVGVGTAERGRRVMSERIESVAADDADYIRWNASGGDHPRLREITADIQQMTIDGDVAPNSIARQSASEMLTYFEAFGVTVRRLMVCADGGITLRVGVAGNSATVECFNSGVVAVARSSGRGTTVVEEVDPTDESSLLRLIGELREFTAA